MIGDDQGGRGQVVDETRCDHAWKFVRMIRFAEAGKPSEVVRCVKCGITSVKDGNVFTVCGLPIPKTSG